MNRIIETTWYASIENRAYLNNISEQNVHVQSYTIIETKKFIHVKRAFIFFDHYFLEPTSISKLFRLFWRKWYLSVIYSYSCCITNCIDNFSFVPAC